MRSRLALCLPFLLLPLAVQETPALPPDDVVRHALGDQQRVIDLLAKYTYTKHVASESSNAKGKVTTIRSASSTMRRVTRRRASRWSA